MPNVNPTLQRWRMVGKLSVLFVVLIGLMSTSLTTRAVESENPAAPQVDPNAPNIVVFLADDMGYSDIGAFGSEIETPNIDSLATNGMMMTNFHTMASCSPTRAELLTGVDNHRNGFGTMASQLAPTQAGQPGYEAVINDRVVTVASLLRNSGYHTFMAGKWHLGNEGGEAGNFWPNQRGFEHSFALLPGAASNFSDRLGFSAGRPVAAYIEDGVSIPNQNGLPSDFYSTEFYTDKIISYTNAITDDKPFFAYFAYTAPHGPLHVPPDDTYVQEILSDTVDYNYQAGWDALRLRRFNRMKELDIIPDDMQLPDRWEADFDGNPIRPWSEIAPGEEIGQQAYEAKRMAIYAAMMRHLDDNIGRFIQHLKDTGEYDNTIFVFFGDNGADDVDRTLLPVYRNWFKALKPPVDNSYANIGNERSFVLQTIPWAQVSATPFWAAKATVAEGGIRNAFVVSYPGVIPAGQRSTALANVIDLTPTFLDYAGILDQHPGVENPEEEGEVYKLDGRSLRTLWQGTATNIYGTDDYVGYELFGTTNKALLSGDGWKILRLGDVPWGDEGIDHPSDQNWKLFNLNTDPGEQTNLAAQYPERFRDMQSRYRAYENRVGFVSAYLREAGSPGQTTTYTFNVTNSADEDDVFVLTCATEWECDAEFGESGQLSTQTVSETVALKAGATIPVTMTLTIPSNIEPDGTRYVNAIQVRSENDPALKLDYTVLTFVGETRTAVPGQKVRYTLKVTNNSNVTDTFDVECESAWSCNLADTDPPFRVTRLAVTLGANESTDVEVTLSVPSSTQIGLFDLTKLTTTSRNTGVVTSRAFLTTAETGYIYLPFVTK